MTSDVNLPVYSINIGSVLRGIAKSYQTVRKVLQDMKTFRIQATKVVTKI
jgi:hypothetical protein